MHPHENADVSSEEAEIRDCVKFAGISAALWCGEANVATGASVTY